MVGVADEYQPVYGSFYILFFVCISTTVTFICFMIYVLRAVRRPPPDLVVVAPKPDPKSRPPVVVTEAAPKEETLHSVAVRPQYDMDVAPPPTPYIMAYRTGARFIRI